MVGDPIAASLRALQNVPLAVCLQPPSFCMSPPLETCGHPGLRLTQVLDSLSCKQMAPVSLTSLTLWQVMFWKGKSTAVVSVNCQGVVRQVQPAVPSQILTFGLSLTVGSGAVVAGTEGCPEVTGELVIAGVGPGVSSIVLGCVAGFSVVGTPWLVWSGFKGVPSVCVGSRLSCGLVRSLLSPGKVVLAAGDVAAASVLKKCNEKDR